MKFGISLHRANIAMLALASFMTGCSDSSSNNEGTPSLNGDFQAAIIGKLGVSSEISLANTALEDDVDTINVDESTNSYNIINGYEGIDLNDMAIAAYGKNYYRIGRYLQDNITKYSFKNPNQIEWQFSVKSDGDLDSNPHDIIFASEEKAYVIRYGSDSVLIINPSVEFNDEENFKIGEIDLSAYNSTDQTVPHMHSAVLDDGKLYVVMQVLDNTWAPGIAKLVIIDTTSNPEVVSQAISLNVKNPIDLDIQGEFLYVTGVGRQERDWLTPPAPAEYTGGIEKINLSNLSSEILVDDGDSITHQYDLISGLVLVSETNGYFLSYKGKQNNALFQFNPSTGEVVSEPLASLTGLDLRFVELSLEGELWVGIGDDTNPEIQIIDPVDNSLIKTIYTDKTPIGVAFSGNLSE
jgi:hypothetical protein